MSRALSSVFFPFFYYKWSLSLSLSSRRPAENLFTSVRRPAWPGAVGPSGQSPTRTRSIPAPARRAGLESWRRWLGVDAPPAPAGVEEAAWWKRGFASGFAARQLWGGEVCRSAWCLLFRSYVVRGASPTTCGLVPLTRRNPRLLRRADTALPFIPSHTD